METISLAADQEIKMNSTLKQAMNVQREVEVQLYSFSNLGTRWSGWSTPSPRPFYPREDLVPIVQEAGCAPGQVWKGAENLPHTGIRSPDRPARSQLLSSSRYSR